MHTSFRPIAALAVLAPFCGGPAFGLGFHIVAPDRTRAFDIISADRRAHSAYLVGYEINGFNRDEGLLDTSAMGMCLEQLRRATYAGPTCSDSRP